jgi:saccharopine dehydrogenase-like NADP-dependent oxidoreductase
MKRVLVLGAGLVSRPLVRHLEGYADVALTVGDLDVAKAAQVLGGAARGRAVLASTSDPAALSRLIGESDLVVSLLPYTLHVDVARIAIERRVPLITTSYVSAEMRALDGVAQAAGVLVLNEIGLDPGLDHMSAMRAIRQLRDEGSRLVSFRSCCGGLPAPEANTNPWGYKFSWSPRGVLAAGRNAARWLEDGRIVDAPGEQLFTHVAGYDVPEVGRLEVYPNRDSVAYVSTYGIEGVRTMFRGTLRYPGWCETLHAVSRLGLLDDTPRAWRPGTTHKEFMETVAVPGTGPTLARVAARAGVPADGAVMKRLEWAGLFSDSPIGSTTVSPIDVLSARLAASMAYAEGERDMIVLRHEFEFFDANGRPGNTVATLVAFGEPSGDSAMARTVSLPAAVAARLILDGRIASTGVRIPVDPEIYEPVLDALEPMGIVFRETQTAP